MKKLIEGCSRMRIKCINNPNRPNHSRLLNKTSRTTWCFQTKWNRKAVWTWTHLRKRTQYSRSWKYLRLLMAFRHSAVRRSVLTASKRVRLLKALLRIIRTSLKPKALIWKNQQQVQQPTARLQRSRRKLKKSRKIHHSRKIKNSRWVRSTKLTIKTKMIIRPRTEQLKKKNAVLLGNLILTVDRARKSGISQLWLIVLKKKIRKEPNWRPS